MRSGSLVDAIQCTWELTNGTTVTGAVHRGSGGSPTTFNLNEGEYINRIEVRSGSLIDSLTFYTSWGNRYGPYGGTAGSQQTPIVAAAPINGFFGRSGSLLDAFGAFSLTTCSP